MQNIFSVVLAVVLSVFLGSSANGEHGVTVNGTLKYPPDFKNFSYTSVQSQKGGELVLHTIGSFDTMNPFTLKGTAPYGMEIFVFDHLGEASLDEPAAEYGLVAKDIAIAEDLLSVTYTLDGKARFSDGTAVAVEDIAFTVEYLKSSDVHPLYPYYYRDISSTEIVDDRRIRFHFAQKNRELPMIATQLPVLSARSFHAGGEGASALIAPVGSGPYVVDNVIQGRSISYKRNPQYWAKDHPTRKGLFNFDRITVKYYKDQVVALEAFKAGDFDVLPVYIAKQWARDLEGPKFTSGELVKTIFPHANNAGMQGFLMNTRRKQFSDPRVRQAIGLAFDFEYTNNALFYGQYTRANSFFSNSHLAAKGVPQGLELSFLEPYRSLLPPEVFTHPLQPPVVEGKGGLRKNLRKAISLLKEAGYSVNNGILTDQEGKPFIFEITLANATFERVMAGFVKNLEKLGMQVSYRTIDQTIYTEKVTSFDYDMIVSTFPQSQSPGNEQRNFWHSEAADRPGSNNYAGVRSAAVDGLVDRIIYAANDEELKAACMALDRVLWYGYYVIPNWYVSGHRVAYRNIFQRPEQLPRFYSPIQMILTWWMK